MNNYLPPVFAIPGNAFMAILNSDSTICLPLCEIKNDEWREAVIENCFRRLDVVLCVLFTASM